MGLITISIGLGMIYLPVGIIAAGTGLLLMGISIERSLNAR
jgi:hypothetical protein